MSNIEAIKEDYKIGDAIRIMGSLGVTEGYIVRFYEDRIKIQPFDEKRKPSSITEENIRDFEEAFPPQKETPKDVTTDNPSSFPIDGEKDVDSSSQAHSTIEIEEKEKEIIASTKNEDDPKFVIGHIDVDKIDPKKGVRPNTTNPWRKALSDQPQIIIPSHLERVAKSYKSEDDNMYFVEANGFITDDLSNYGWIWDQNLETKIWFSSEDICDDQLYNINNLVGIHVSYIKVNGTKGPKAIGICLPRPIYQLLALADEKQDDKSTKQSAYDIVELIISNYPENEDALSIQKQLKKSIQKRSQHSITNPLSIEYLKEYVNNNGNVRVNKSNKTGREAKLADEEYKKAKALVNEKRHEEALPHYLNSFNAQKSITLIKDISSLYCSLCGKKYIQGHPERVEKAAKYREAGRKFLSEYARLLPKDQSSYNFLESSYYVLQDYEKYLEIVDKIIRVKVPSQRVIYLNKKAIAFLALNKKEDALGVLNQILDIDSQNTNAKRLQEQINSNADVNEVIAELFEVSDNPISPFLQDTLDNYSQFFGVDNYIFGDHERLYGEATYKSIVNQIEGASSDSQKRSLLLLTKIKLDEVRNEGVYDKRDFALYCNDMARVSMLKNPNAINWDVVRFYFNEAFSLTVDWSSTRRQFIQYLETLIPSKRNNIFGKLPQSEQASRFKEDLACYINENDEKYDMDWIDGLMHPSLYNEEISRRTAEEIYRDKNLFKCFSRKNKIDNIEKLSEDEFIQKWKSLRDSRYSSERGLVNSFLSRTKHDSLTRLNNSMEGLQEATNVSWLFHTDRERIKEIFTVLIPKIESFILSQSYQGKEDCFHDANMLLDNIKKEIQNNPTKFSYDALLPLLDHFHNLLNEEWKLISLTSRPNVTISLLTTSSYKDYEGIVNLQIAVSNDKESSPISKIRLELQDNPYVNFWNFEEKIYNDLLKGGDQPILFHLSIKLNPLLTEKAISICVNCIYENTNNSEESKQQDLSVRFYSESEYEPFDNPYNAGDTVEKRNMFFGRDSFISNLVNVMHSSPSKQLVFYGQKRSGKSSVLYWLQKELENQGAFCARFSMGILRRDLRDVTFFWQILYTITRALSRYKNDKPSFSIPKIKDFEAENPTNPVQTFSSYMAEFKDACKSTPGWENKLIVVMIDEFTYIYTGIKEGKVDYTILQQWKSVIQDPDSSFAAVLVGQDVIPYFKEEEYARNVFQMMDDYRLNYLDYSDAKDLVETPIGKQRYASGTVEMILELSACNPYYIQMLCGELVSDMNKKKSIIATTADITEVAQRIIRRLTFEDFDNLISPGDAITIEGITEKSTSAVLYRIAKLTETKEYCTLSDIVSYYKEDILEDEKNTIEKVLDNLYNREVIEKNSGLYKIKVKLFQLWMLNQTPKTASLKEQGE